MVLFVFTHICLCILCNFFIFIFIHWFPSFFSSSLLRPAAFASPCFFFLHSRIPEPYLKPNTPIPLAARDGKTPDFCRVRHNPLLENNKKFQEMMEQFTKVCTRRSAIFVFVSLSVYHTWTEIGCCDVGDRLLRCFRRWQVSLAIKILWRLELQFCILK